MGKKLLSLLCVLIFVLQLSGGTFMASATGSGTFQLPESILAQFAKLGINATCHVTKTEEGLWFELVTYNLTLSSAKLGSVTLTGLISEFSESTDPTGTNGPVTCAPVLFADQTTLAVTKNNKTALYDLNKSLTPYCTLKLPLDDERQLVLLPYNIIKTDLGYIVSLHYAEGGYLFYDKSGRLVEAHRYRGSIDNYPNYDSVRLTGFTEVMPGYMLAETVVTKDTMATMGPYTLRGGAGPSFLIRTQNGKPIEFSPVEPFIQPINNPENTDERLLFLRKWEVDGDEWPGPVNIALAVHFKPGQKPEAFFISGMENPDESRIFKLTGQLHRFAEANATFVQDGTVIVEYPEYKLRYTFDFKNTKVTFRYRKQDRFGLPAPMHPTI